MFRVFRKLRLTYLVKGQFGRYFSYACGEILLIVVGILIALQLNNWNETRKNHVKLDATLLKLADELAINEERFKWILEKQEYFLSSAQLLFDTHLSDEKIKGSDNDLMNAFYFSNLFPTINFADEAYRNLVSNTEFSSRTYENLKAMIVEYYEKVNWLTSQQESVGPLVRDLVSDTYEFTVIRPGGDDNVLQRSANENGEYGWGTDRFTIAYDLEAFRANSSLNGKLYDLIDFHKDRIGSLRELTQLGQEITAEIKLQSNNH